MTHKPEVADKVLERLACGESLVAICRDEGMPGLSTVYRWLDEDEAFRDRYARARETQADTLFNEVLTIADEARADDVAAARLRIDARKWMAGKLRPKVYGDKLEVGMDPERPWQPIAVIERQVIGKAPE